MQKHFIGTSITTLSIALLTLGSAHAATWLGGTGGYTDGLQWDTGLAPAATEEITISAGEATHPTGTNLARNGITTLSGTGSLIVNARYLGGNQLNISDNAQLTVNGQYLLVGNTSVGTVTQTGGSVTGTISRGFFLSDGGAQAGSSYFLRGGTLSITHTTDGSTDENLNSFHIGKGGSNDYFEIDGGSAIFTDSTGAGVSKRVFLSRGSTLALMSGSAAFDGYENFTIGRYSGGSTSLLLMSGGTFTVTNLANHFIVGQDESGSVSLSGGTMSISSSILLGGGSSFGSFSMTGGTLTAADILTGTGFSSFDFAGGDIFLTGDRTSILDEVWFTETADTVATYNPGTNLTHIHVVPEPSAAALVALPLLLGLTRRKRR